MDYITEGGISNICHFAGLWKTTCFGISRGVLQEKTRTAKIVDERSELAAIRGLRNDVDLRR